MVSDNREGQVHGRDAETGAGGARRDAETSVTRADEGGKKGSQARRAELEVKEDEIRIGEMLPWREFKNGRRLRGRIRL